MTDENPPPPEQPPEAPARIAMRSSEPELHGHDPQEPVAAIPPPEAQPEPAYAASEPVRAPVDRRRGSALPVLCAIGFLLLVAGLAWLWNGQQKLVQRIAELPPPPAAADPAQVAALDGRVQALEQKLAQLAAAPPPAPVAAKPPPPVDLGPLQARIAALEARKPPPPVDVAADTAPLAARVESLAAELAAARSAQAGAAGRIDELTGQVKAAAQQQTALAGKAAQLQAVAQASAALTAGEPLGQVPDAPPALAQFATAKPPTEAQLRLSFPAAAAAATEASKPITEGKPLAERILVHVRSLVTVKHGDEVLVGTSAATVLGNAQSRLDAGDLGGAVAALDGLDPSAAHAMAAWRGQAQSLLDARAALAQLGHG